MTLQATNLKGNNIEIHSEELNDLKDKVKGELIFSDSKNYEETRKVWNGLIDKKPAVIIKATDADDVLASVRFAMKNQLPISARCGGHNVAGNSVNDQGIVVDLSNMKKITIDAERKTAIVQGGARWEELDAETQKYGLAVPGGVVSDTGIAGLTLGGGLGWLRRKYGLSCDNLLSVEIVTGQGELIKANQYENQDLFWAIRGGGGNFGIVTSFEFQLHEIGKSLFMSLNFHPLNDAADTINFYRNYVSQVKDEVSTMAIFGSIPAYPLFPENIHGKPVVLLAACYAGTVEEGRKELESFRAFGDPITNINDSMPYVIIQKIFDEDYPEGRLYYWKSIYVNELTDTIISILQNATIHRPSSLSTIDIWHMGGAIKKNKTGVFPNRDSEFMISIEANWDKREDTNKNIEWARDLYKAILPYSTGGSYLNFPGFYEEGGQNLFGEHQLKIEEIKTKYDPHHLFKILHK